MPYTDHNATLRCALEQAGHCVAEALSVVLHDESPGCALNDVRLAIALLEGKVAVELEVMARTPRPDPAADRKK
jgi:hypothetical protein